MKLSIVIPVYNEAKNISKLHDQLLSTLKDITSSYEIIFINDGSTDASEQIINTLRRKNKKVTSASFSRNFGHMAAVSAGLHYSKGDKVVVMDADLQDPPKIIKKLYDKSHKYDVVYAIKKRRNESWFMNFMFKSFYAIQTRVAELPIPANAGTFSIIDKKVVNTINALPERNKFFSGLRVWSGFKQSHIYYNRLARNAGKRKAMQTLIRMGLDGIFSFSYAPLRLASLIGIILAMLSILLIAAVIFTRIFFNFGLVGWASTLTVILFIGAVQLITLGIIGEYLARIYDEVKKRPEYIVSHTEGVTSSKRK